MSDTLSEFVQELKLNYAGEPSGNSYVMTIGSSDEFSSVYNTLSSVLDIAESADADTDSYNAVLTDGYIEAVCSADYINDKYTITISER